LNAVAPVLSNISHTVVGNAVPLVEAIGGSVLADLSISCLGGLGFLAAATDGAALPVITPAAVECGGGVALGAGIIGNGLRTLHRVDDGGSGGGEVAAEDGADASTPVGRQGSPLDVPRGTNTPTSIDGTSFSGHAIDELQSDGIPPSAANDAIRNGESAASRGGTTVYYSPANNISVVQSSSGNVVTVSYGDLRP
jgi:hypothetical protein